MSMQPGVGYTFTSSILGTTLDIQQPWTAPGASGPGLQIAFEFNTSDKLPQHWQAVVSGVPGDYRLRVANSGNIWRPVNSDCDEESVADVLTPSASVGALVPMTDVDSPYASTGSYIPVLIANTYYVYAYKVEGAEFGTNFYIYVSLDGTLADACPVAVPAEITAPPDPVEYTVQALLVAQVYYGADLLWHSYQHVLGTIAWPQDLGFAINHYQLAIRNVDGEDVLKIGSGGHIYRLATLSCDDTEFTEVITPDSSGPSAVVVVDGNQSGTPWASDNGYVQLNNGSEFYVYAYKVETANEATFYIYVSKISDLDEECPATTQAGMTTPAVAYTVQCLKIGSAIKPTGGDWLLEQRLIGSIAWPQDVLEKTHQFEVQINADPANANIMQVKVARGSVIKRTAANPSNNVLDFPTCLRHYNVKDFVVYPTGSLTTGATAGSVWASNNGYVSISNEDNDGADEWGVYLIMNDFGGGPLADGKPYLAVMANGSFAKLNTNHFGGCDYAEYADFLFFPYVNYFEVIGKSQKTPGSPYFDFAGIDAPLLVRKLKNYACQRLRLATIKWDNVTSNWYITHHGYGPITIPANRHKNMYIDYHNYESAPFVPEWFYNSLYELEDINWNNPYSGYTKGSASGTTIIAT